MKRFGETWRKIAVGEIDERIIEFDIVDAVRTIRGSSVGSSRIERGSHGEKLGHVLPGQQAFNPARAVDHGYGVISKVSHVDFAGVGIGRADIHIPAAESPFEGIVIEENVIISPGAKVLCKEGVLRVRRGTMIGANAVLLESTGENEIWAGIPARRIGTREGNDGNQGPV